MLIKLKHDKIVTTLKNLVSFDAFDEDIRKQGKEVGINIYHMNEVIEAGRNAITTHLKEPTKDTIYMFCYTSGTTGDPKAAMLSHGNMIAVAAAAVEHGVILTEEDISISYLPLAHSFEKCIFVIGTIHGC